MDNRSKVFSNLIWRFFERGGSQLVSFAVSIVLARLLDPALYGTVSKVTVITAILLVFVDSGIRLVHFVTLAKLFPVFAALTIFGQERGPMQLVLPNVCGSEKRVHPQLGFKGL